MRLPIAAVALAGLAGIAEAGDRPARVVSINLCTDQLAMLLADPGQLVSISRIASDPLMNPLAGEAGGYTLNGGGAEEIFLMHPDLVLAADWSDPVALGMMRRLGLTVVQVPIATGLADIPGAIRSVGSAIGQVEKAEKMAIAAETRLGAIPEASDAGPVAAFYYANGYTLGEGTLGNDIIEAAGFRNLAMEMGQSGGGNLALESLIVENPDILISSEPYAGSSRAEDTARHPALAGFFKSGRVVESGPEWVCGTPLTLDAVDRMAALRATLD